MKYNVGDYVIYREHPDYPPMTSLINREGIVVRITISQRWPYQVTFDGKLELCAELELHSVDGEE